MNTIKTAPKLTSLKIKMEVDDSPDTSWIGEYTDDAADWNIDRRTGEYVIDLRPGECNCGAAKAYEEACNSELVHSPAEWEALEAHADSCPAGREWEAPRRGREYSFFQPYAGGEKPGTDDYRKYGLQDFERMEGLNRGDLYFCGIVAVADVETDHGQYRRIHNFRSGGLWGIESDSGREHFVEVAQEELGSLRTELEAFGVDLADWDDMAEAAIDDME